MLRVSRIVMGGSDSRHEGLALAPKTSDKLTIFAHCSELHIDQIHECMKSGDDHFFYACMTESNYTNILHNTEDGMG